MLSPRRVRVLCVACLSVTQAAPPGERGGVRVNGVRFELRMLVLPGEPEALARRLDGRWGERQTLDSAVGPSRSALGRQRGAFHETLTLLPGPHAGSSRAVVAVQDLREPPAPVPAAPIPLPVAARVINVVQFDGRRDGAATFTIDAPGAPHGALERLWRAAEARGWQRIASPADVNTPGAAFWARRGVQEITVVALPAASRTRIVMLLTGGDPKPARSESGPSESRP